MLKILQRIKYKTYCKHCKKEFENLWICKMDSIIGIRYALLCTGCQKLIGIYSSKDLKEQIITAKIIFDELHNRNWGFFIWLLILTQMQVLM
jgi:hypothetical protein